MTAFFSKLEGLQQMKIQIESTDKIVELRFGRRLGAVYGDAIVPARVWEGKTDSGVPVHCFITRICPTVEDKPENKPLFEQFERELAEQAKPSVEIATIPLRLVL